MIPRTNLHDALPARAQESKKDASLAVASHKTLEYGQVVLSTDNIFNRCRARSRIGYPGESQPLHQLDVVGNFVSDLSAITRAWKQEQAKKAARAEGGGDAPHGAGLAAQASSPGVATKDGREA